MTRCGTSCSPENIILGAACICIDGVDVGLTTGGVTVRYDREFLDVEADQINGIARKGVQLERMFITTTLLEAALPQLQVAFGLPLANLTSATTLCLGYNNSCYLAEHQVAIFGPGPSCGCRTFTFDRVVSASTSIEYTMSRSQEVQVEVEFEVLKDCNSTCFGIITDGCVFQDAQVCT